MGATTERIEIAMSADEAGAGITSNTGRIINAVGHAVYPEAKALAKGLSKKALKAFGNLFR